MNILNFNSLAEFHEYIPQCLICGKDMYYALSLYGKSPQQRTYSLLKYNLEIRDNLAQSKAKKQKQIAPITIDISSNEIIDGVDLFHNSHNGSLHKICCTCHCKIFTSFQKPEKKGLFPKLILTSEELKYMRKGGKSFELKNWYNAYGNNTVSCTLKFDGKNLTSPVPIELYKFKDLDHVNKRIGTIITFH